MTDVMSAAKRSALMARIRGTNTTPELALRRALGQMGLRYRVSPPEVFGQPDVVLARSKVAVFVDGCFWHGCKVHYVRPSNNREFWASKLEANRARDQRVNRELRDEGWRVLRVWEHEINRDPLGPASRIAWIVRLQSQQGRGRSGARRQD